MTWVVERFQRGPWNGARFGPSRAAVVAGDDLEVAVGLFLDEHQELAGDDEGATLLAGSASPTGPLPFATIRPRSW